MKTTTDDAAPEATDGPGTEAPVPRKTRAYLSGAERERQIVQGAIGYFAEHGFGGSTRELAERLGIAQGLLFRHFPTKEDLIERIYKELFSGRWDPQWELTLQDRSRPLPDRMTAVYTSYAERINRYEWVRIYLFAGLHGTRINARYWGLVREKIMLYVLAELRRLHGKPALEEVPPSEAEMELIWGLHAAVFYLGIRRWVYHLPTPDAPSVISRLVLAFLDAAPRVLDEPAASGATQPQPLR